MIIINILFISDILWFVSTVKPVLRDHIKQDIFLAFQIGGCLLLHVKVVQSAFRAISNHLSIAISMSPEWMVA